MILLSNQAVGTAGDKATLIAAIIAGAIALIVGIIQVVSNRKRAKENEKLQTELKNRDIELQKDIKGRDEKLQTELKNRDERIADNIQKLNEELQKNLQINSYEQEYFKELLKRKINVLDQINRFIAKVQNYNIKNWLNSNSIFSTEKEIEAILNNEYLWMLPELENKLYACLQEFKTLKWINSYKNTDNERRIIMSSNTSRIKQRFELLSENIKISYLNSHDIEVMKHLINQEIANGKKKTYVSYLADRMNNAGIYCWWNKSETKSNDIVESSYIISFVTFVPDEFIESNVYTKDYLHASPINCNKYKLDIYIPIADNLKLYKNIEDLILDLKEEMLPQKYIDSISNQIEAQIENYMFLRNDSEEIAELKYLRDKMIPVLKNLRNFCLCIYQDIAEKSPDNPKIETEPYNM